MAAAASSTAIPFPLCQELNACAATSGGGVSRFQAPRDSEADHVPHRYQIQCRGHQSVEQVAPEEPKRLAHQHVLRVLPCVFRGDAVHGNQRNHAEQRNAGPASIDDHCLLLLVLSGLGRVPFRLPGLNGAELSGLESGIFS